MLRSAADVARIGSKINSCIDKLTFIAYSIIYNFKCEERKSSLSGSSREDMSSAESISCEWMSEVHSGADRMSHICG